MSVPYKTTPVFDEESFPDAIRREHRTKPGTWGPLCVLEGRVTFVFVDPNREVEVPPEQPARIARQVTHFVCTHGPMRLLVEFHHECPVTDEGGCDG